MTKPEQFDVVELLVDLPEHTLRAGMRGAIVDCYADQVYEVEFANSDGETLALVTLPPQQLIVVWQAKNKTWVSVAEQIESLVMRLTEDARREVLDFARFIYERRQIASRQSQRGNRLC